MLLLMLAPAVFYTLLFSYLPMVGIVLAFKTIIMPMAFSKVLGRDSITSVFLYLRTSI